MVDITEKGPILRDSEKQAEMKELYLRNEEQQRKAAEHRRRTENLEGFAKDAIRRGEVRYSRETVRGPVLVDPQSKEVKEKRAALNAEINALAQQYLQLTPSVVKKALQEHKVTIGGIPPAEA